MPPLKKKNSRKHLESLEGVGRPYFTFWIFLLPLTKKSLKNSNLLTVAGPLLDQETNIRKL